MMLKYLNAYLSIFGFIGNLTEVKKRKLFYFVPEQTGVESKLLHK